jgi:hypothetical protein
LFPVLRDDKEPFALSVPLSDLDTDELPTIAETNGKIDLPVAVGFRAIDNSIELAVDATNGPPVSGKETAINAMNAQDQREYEKELKERGQMNAVEQIVKNESTEEVVSVFALFRSAMQVERMYGRFRPEMSHGELVRVYNLLFQDGILASDENGKTVKGPNWIAPDFFKEKRYV